MKNSNNTLPELHAELRQLRERIAELEVGTTTSTRESHPVDAAREALDILNCSTICPYLAERSGMAGRICHRERGIRTRVSRIRTVIRVGEIRADHSPG